MPERGTPWEQALGRAASEEFADILRRDMGRVGVTQSELARRLGVSKTRVFQMLHAENLTLRSMCAAMDAVGRRLTIGSEGF